MIKKWTSKTSNLILVLLILLIIIILIDIIHRNSSIKTIDGESSSQSLIVTRHDQVTSNIESTATSLMNTQTTNMLVTNSPTSSSTTTTTTSTTTMIPTTTTTTDFRLIQYCKVASNSSLIIGNNFIESNKFKLITLINTIFLILI